MISLLEPEVWGAVIDFVADPLIKWLRKGMQAEAAADGDA